MLWSSEALKWTKSNKNTQTFFNPLLHFTLHLFSPITCNNIGHTKCPGFSSSPIVTQTALDIHHPYWSSKVPHISTFYIGHQKCPRFPPSILVTKNTPDFHLLYWWVLVKIHTVVNNYNSYTQQL